jgi:lysyl-tRNA synthetase class I
LIFEAAESTGLTPKRLAFAAVYVSFYGRAHGPRAGWVLANEELDFVVTRLRDAAGPAPAGGQA